MRTPISVESEVSGRSPSVYWEQFNDKVERFIEYTEERAHLLIGRGGIDKPVYGFPHRTIQEYLAACHLAADRRFGRKAKALAAEGDTWREVLLLAIGTLVFNRSNREKALDAIEDVLPLRTCLPGKITIWRMAAGLDGGRDAGGSWPGVGGAG